jgi:hypothetical protein
MRWRSLVRDRSVANARFWQPTDETSPLVGFYEIARRYGSVFRKILKRGRVKSETEYYLVHGALADCANSLADDERAELIRLIEGFESATVGKRL